MKKLKNEINKKSLLQIFRIDSILGFVVVLIFFCNKSPLSVYSTFVFMYDLHACASA